MPRTAVFFAACFCAAGAASAAGADPLALFDEDGAGLTIETAALEGCRIVFDSAGTPFEICRMRKVELTPPAPTRARPGETAAPERRGADVIYVKADE
ncbi:MAG: hypothetical protein ACK5MQ_03570 [Pikeienuella sp.]